MPRKSSRRSNVVEDSDNEADTAGDAMEVDDEAVPDTMFSSQMPEGTQDIFPVKAHERKNLLEMNEEAREKAISDLTRLVLFKALAGEAINRTKCIKEAGISDFRIGTAAFEQAEIRLKNCFDFELKRIPDYVSKMKGLPAKYKDMYFVVNEIDDTNGSHSIAIHSVHENSTIENGVLMLILALAYCKGYPRSDGSRWILDKDLYILLNRLDENIPAEPPQGGVKRRGGASTQQSARFSGGGGVALTPDVDALLEKFCHHDYLLKEKFGTGDNFAACQNAEETSLLYAMGPRAAMEIGRRQIVYFAAEVLGEEPDPTMLNEIKEDGTQDMEETQMTA